MESPNREKQCIDELVARIEQIDKRLQQREREAKYTRLAAIGVAVCALSLAGACKEETPAAFSAKTVRTQNLEVLDANGKLCAAFAPHIIAGAAGPGLGLFDKNGSARAYMALDSKGIPYMGLADKDGKERASLSLDLDGSPSLRLTDKDDEHRARLLLLPDGSPGLGLADKDGKFRAWLSLRPNGSPDLGLADKDGKRLWTAP
jgi:hypothetical protein